MLSVVVEPSINTVSPSHISSAAFFPHFILLPISSYDSEKQAAPPFVPQSPHRRSFAFFYPIFFSYILIASFFGVVLMYFLSLDLLLHPPFILLFYKVINAHFLFGYALLLFRGNCKTNVFQLKFLGRNKKFHPILILRQVETFYFSQK